MYIFESRDSAVNYLTSLNIDCGSNYLHYIYKTRLHTTRFDISYSGMLCGYVENENFNEVSSNRWVIHIPVENRSKLEAMYNGILEAIYTGDDTLDNGISEKYYLSPNAYTTIEFKDCYSNSYTFKANGPDSKSVIRINSNYFKLYKDKMGDGSYQTRIEFDIDTFVQAVRYKFSDLVDTTAQHQYKVSELSKDGVVTYPSVIYTAVSGTPKWEPLGNIEVKSCVMARDSEHLDGYLSSDFVKQSEFNSNVHTVFNQYSYNSGFRSVCNSGITVVSTRPVNIKLLGDVTGEATLKNFQDVSIECKVLEKPNCKNICLALPFDSDYEYDNGTFVKLNTDGKVIPTTSDDDIIGVIQTNPGILLGGLKSGLGIDFVGVCYTGIATLLPADNYTVGSKYRGFLVLAKDSNSMSILIK